MTETEIAGTCLGFFFEAYDSSPNTLVWALYLLAKNKHIQDELARSIEESIAANDNQITYDLVQKHEYLDKVLYGTRLSEQKRIFFRNVFICIDHTHRDHKVSTIIFRVTKAVHKRLHYASSSESEKARDDTSNDSHSPTFSSKF